MARCGAMEDRPIAITVAGAVAGALLTAGALALARRCAPVKDAAVDRALVAALRKKYAWFELASLLPTFACWAGITWVLYWMMRRASDWMTGAGGYAGELAITPEPAVLILPAFLLSILLAVPPMMLLSRLLLGPARYREFSLAWRYGEGLDQVRLWWLVMAVMAPAGLGLAVLLVDHYTLATRSELVVNPFWTLTEHRRRPYTDVEAVYEVVTYKDPTYKDPEPYYLVRFRDGSRWSTRDDAYSARASLKRRVALLIAERAGVGVQQVRSLPAPG